MIVWNPWHGCHKISEGCRHCYMYFLDGKRGIDTSKVFRTENFRLPLKRNRDGSFKYPSGMEMFVGLSTDFFVEEADAWRDEAWAIIRLRPDIIFRIPDKRQQSAQAFRSGLSYRGTPQPYRLRSPEESLFKEPILRPEPFFRPHCATCGSRPICNGCSNCGACESGKGSPDEGVSNR